MSALDAFANASRWVAWRNEDRNDRATKIPYAPQGGKAKADDPATWSSRADAEYMAKLLVNGSGGGVGIQLGDLGDGNFLGGIDLDSCLGDDGALRPWAKVIVDAVPTYAEKSPSGRGIKMFFCVASAAVRPFLQSVGVGPEQWGCRRGVPGEDGRDHGPAIEVYFSGRYFTVTGNLWPGAPDNIATLDVAHLERLAGLIPASKPSGSGNANGARVSRSEVAFAIGQRAYRDGKTFEEFCEAVRNDAEAASWYVEKGISNDNRELRRIWDKAAAEDLELDLVRVSDIAARKVRWLWPGCIARGKVTLLVGNPGLGKSQASLDIAAIVTSGGQWPVEGTRADVGSVIILSAEDDPEDTIRPRLEAAGADLDRCHILRAVREGKGTAERVRGFSLAKDLNRLQKALAQIEDVALVIIDPISAYLGTIDAHNNADVRGVLAPLGELATTCNVAILGISHLRKSGDGQAILQIMGSVGFVAAARAAYVVARDSTDDSRRLFLALKNNLADDGKGFAYRIEPVSLAGGIETSRIVWEADAVTITADEALTPRNSGASPPSRRDMAALWLRAMLSGEPVPVPEIKAKAKAASFSWATVRRAADQIGIDSEKTGFDGGWVWSLPGKGATGNEGEQ